MKRLEGSMPIRTPTVNELLRMHWRVRGRLQRRVALELYVALGLARWRPAQPWARARVRIERYSPQQPDADALPGTAKLVLDALQPPSKRHPYGLAVIAGDRAAELEVEVVHVGRRLQRTDIWVEDLS